MSQRKPRQTSKQVKAARKADLDSRPAMDMYLENWYPIPNWLSIRTEVSSDAKLAYGALVRVADIFQKNTFNLEYLAKELGITPEGLEKALDELNNFRLIVLDEDLAAPQVEFTLYGGNHWSNTAFTWGPDRRPIHQNNFPPGPFWFPSPERLQQLEQEEQR